jgi:hypothetical protein
MGCAILALRCQPGSSGTAFHIRDLADTSQFASIRKGSYKIDFSKAAARAYINSIVQRFAAMPVQRNASSDSAQPRLITDMYSDLTLKRRRMVWSLPPMGGDSMRSNPPHDRSADTNAPDDSAMYHRSV